MARTAAEPGGRGARRALPWAGMSRARHETRERTWGWGSSWRLSWPRGDAAISRSAARPACPEGMAFVHGFCIDRWEDHVVELDGSGAERPTLPIFRSTGWRRASSRDGTGGRPQDDISQIQSAAACARARKRLCSEEEFSLACRGTRADDIYPYGGCAKVPGYCNEGKGSMLPVLFGAEPSRWKFADLNDAGLNQIDVDLRRPATTRGANRPEGIPGTAWAISTSGPRIRRTRADMAGCAAASTVTRRETAAAAAT